MATSLNEVNFPGFDLVWNIVGNQWLISSAKPSVFVAGVLIIWKSFSLLWRICMWWHHILTDTHVGYTGPHVPFSSHHFSLGRNLYQSEIFKIFELMYGYENSLDIHSQINIHNIHKKIISSYMLQGTQKVSIWILFSYCVIYQYAFSWSVYFMYNHIQCDL